MELRELKTNARDPAGISFGALRYQAKICNAVWHKRFERTHARMAL